MVGFNPFSSNFNVDKYTTVTVADGYHSFRLLLAYLGHYDGEPKFILYWPDYSSEAFGNYTDYRVTISHWEHTKSITDVDVVINPTNSSACVPFKFEAHEYNEFIPIGWEVDVNSEELPVKREIKAREWYYVTIKPWQGDLETGHVRKDFVGSQNAFNLLNDFNMALDVRQPYVGHRYQGEGPNVYSPYLTVHIYHGGQEMTLEELQDEVRNMYDDDTIKMEATMYISDDTNIYALALIENTSLGEIICPTPSEDIANPWFRPYYNAANEMKFAKTGLLPQWYDTMRIYCWVKFKRVNEFDEETELIGFRTNMVPVTSTMWAFWKAGSTIEIGNFKMSNFPRTINKTIQQVTNISATTSSHAGIVQPVFIRVQKAANIVVHPAVNENICINLDAYKASVEEFTLKIEGASFPETGRTASGVIFNVVGNDLPANLLSGVYYILNENKDLVTTGRYTYEQ